MPTLRRLATLALMLAIATSAFAADRTRPAEDKRQTGLFTIVNATFDSVTGIAMSSARTDDFIDVNLGEPLRGGLTSATIRLPPGACLRDVRVTFRDGRSKVFPGIDVCRSSALRLSV